MAKKNPFLKETTLTAEEKADWRIARGDERETRIRNVRGAYYSSEQGLYEINSNLVEILKELRKMDKKLKEVV